MPASWALARWLVLPLVSQFTDYHLVGSSEAPLRGLQNSRSLEEGARGASTPASSSIVTPVRTEQVAPRSSNLQYGQRGAGFNEPPSALYAGAYHGSNFYLNPNAYYPLPAVHGQPLQSFPHPQDVPSSSFPLAAGARRWTLKGYVVETVEEKFVPAFPQSHAYQPYPIPPFGLPHDHAVFPTAPTYVPPTIGPFDHPLGSHVASPAAPYAAPPRPGWTGEQRFPTSARRPTTTGSSGAIRIASHHDQRATAPATAVKPEKILGGVSSAAAVLPNQGKKSKSHVVEPLGATSQSSGLVKPTPQNSLRVEIPTGSGQPGGPHQSFALLLRRPEKSQSFKANRQGLPFEGEVRAEGSDGGRTRPLPKDEKKSVPLTNKPTEDREKAVTRSADAAASELSTLTVSQKLKKTKSKKSGPEIETPLKAEVSRSQSDQPEGENPAPVSSKKWNPNSSSNNQAYMREKPEASRGSSETGKPLLTNPALGPSPKKDSRGVPVGDASQKVITTEANKVDQEKTLGGVTAMGESIPQLSEKSHSQTGQPTTSGPMPSVNVKVSQQTSSDVEASAGSEPPEGTRQGVGVPPTGKGEHLKKTRNDLPSQLPRVESTNTEHVESLSKDDKPRIPDKSKFTEHSGIPETISAGPIVSESSTLVASPKGRKDDFFRGKKSRKKTQTAFKAYLPVQPGSRSSSDPSEGKLPPSGASKEMKRLASSPQVLESSGTRMSEFLGTSQPKDKSILHDAASMDVKSESDSISYVSALQMGSSNVPESFLPGKSRMQGVNSRPDSEGRGEKSGETLATLGVTPSAVSKTPYIPAANAEKPLSQTPTNPGNSVFRLPKDKQIAVLPEKKKSKPPKPDSGEQNFRTTSKLLKVQDDGHIVDPGRFAALGEMQEGLAKEVNFEPSYSNKFPPSKSEQILSKESKALHVSGEPSSTLKAGRAPKSTSSSQETESSVTETSSGTISLDILAESTPNVGEMLKKSKTKTSGKKKSKKTKKGRKYQHWKADDAPTDSPLRPERELGGKVPTESTLEGRQVPQSSQFPTSLQKGKESLPPEDSKKIRGDYFRSFFSPSVDALTHRSQRREGYIPKGQVKYENFNKVPHSRDAFLSEALSQKFQIEMLELRSYCAGFSNDLSESIVSEAFGSHRNKMEEEWASLGLDERFMTAFAYGLRYGSLGSKHSEPPGPAPFILKDVLEHDRKLFNQCMGWFEVKCLKNEALLFRKESLLRYINDLIIRESAYKK